MFLIFTRSKLIFYSFNSDSANNTSNANTTNINPISDIAIFVANNSRNSFKSNSQLNETYLEALEKCAFLFGLLPIATVKTLFGTDANTCLQLNDLIRNIQAKINLTKNSSKQQKNVAPKNRKTNIKAANDDALVSLTDISMLQ